jgi:hypothetical protein
MVDTICLICVLAPYKITISFVGYESQVYNEVYLELGKPLILDAQLNDVSQQLTEVKVTGSKNKVFGNGTGAETTIGRKELTCQQYQGQRMILHV